MLGPGTAPTNRCRSMPPRPSRQDKEDFLFQLRFPYFGDVVETINHVVKGSDLPRDSDTVIDALWQEHRRALTAVLISLELPAPARRDTTLPANYRAALKDWIRRAYAYSGDLEE